MLTIMITVDSNQVIVVRNPVVYVPAPVVLVLGMFTGVLKIPMHVTTAKDKPKKEVEEKKNQAHKVHV